MCYLVLLLPPWAKCIFTPTFYWFVLQLYIEGLCHGNMLEEEAVNISSIFTSYFSVPPLPAEMRHEEYVMCLPSGADLVRDVRVKNKLDTNSVVEVIPKKKGKKRKEKET